MPENMYSAMCTVLDYKIQSVNFVVKYINTLPSQYVIYSSQSSSTVEMSAIDNII